MSTSTSEGSPGLAKLRLGISLSGGGIRSSTFSLCVVQRLIEAGYFERARYLSAVSGGSYIAAGMAISRARCPEELEAAIPPPWGRGSPEEAQLRRNLSYLAPGGKGRLWLFANALYGLALNLIPLLLGAYLAGRLVGLALRQIYPGMASGATVDLAALSWVGLTIAALFAAVVAVVGHRRFLDKDRSRSRMTSDLSERWVMWLLGVAFALVALVLVLPAILIGLSHIRSTQVTLLGLGDFGFSLRRVIIGLVVVVLALGLGGVAVWAMRHRRAPVLRAVCAYVSGLGILFAPFALAAETSAARAWIAAVDLPVFLGGGAVILMFAVLVHNRRYSMHLFYRERLQDAFATSRDRRDGELIVKKIPYDESIYLSEIGRQIRAKRRHRRFPELVICTAVAARGSEVPTKTWAASFPFEREKSGNQKLGLRERTEFFESGDWIGGGDITLPSIMAISGAAVSPLMGRFTLPAFRFLMAVMNIRLGVWIRNPKEGSERRLHPDASTVRRLFRYLVRGWREPGAWYVLKEGLGLVDANHRYIYVSDGGHWENLGLTELLRKRCTAMIVVDASGDPGLGDIGRAMSVARAELGIEFKLDPRVTLPQGDQLPDSPVAIGKYIYPDGMEGEIYYLRSVMWSGAPGDLHLLAARDPQFPNHPTANQFLSAELFDAYRALGWAAGSHLVEEHLHHLLPSDWDES